jgi:hypothetical protein
MLCSAFGNEIPHELSPLQLLRLITVDNIWECLRLLQELFLGAHIKQDITHLLRRFNDLAHRDHPNAVGSLKRSLGAPKYLRADFVVSKAFFVIKLATATCLYLERIDL